MASHITIDHKPIGRWRASWLLLCEAWRFLRADTELLLIPVVAGIALVVLVVTQFVVLFLSGLVTVSSSESVASPLAMGVVFLFYVTAVLITTLANAAITHTVATRASGGNASLSESINVALSRIGSLLLWSVIASTVGVALKFVSERSALLGRLVTGLLGAAWGILTIFVIPAMVLEKHAAHTAIRHSAVVFRRTWGETLVTNISIGLIFFLLHIIALVVFLGSLFLSTLLEMPIIFGLGIAAWLLWILIAILIQQVLATIVTTLLYIYATATVPPSNFNSELLGQILQRTNKTTGDNSIQ